MCIIIPFTFLFAVVTPLFAEHHEKHEHDPDRQIIGNGHLPEGWLVRLDRPTADPSNLKFVVGAKGYQIVSGPAAIYYRAVDVRQGKYTVQCSFTQAKALAHPEAYGVFFGGSDLDAANQRYLYFLVRQDGRYLIKQRDDADTHIIVDWTEHAAVNKKDEGGRATNQLSVIVGADKMQFNVNGEEVKSIARSDLLNSDGHAGLRVNHNLDLEISDFRVSPADPME